jgi:hypothetical protein
MELPHSKTRQAYIEQISVVEANLKEATSGAIDRALLSQVQKRLDTLAGKYQYNEEIGTARYKLYELQALVHFFKGDDDDALDFINQAIEVRGDSYARAEKLKSQLLEKTKYSHSQEYANNGKDKTMKKAGATKKKNKLLSVSLSILNVLVVLISWGLGRTYPLPACILAAIYFSIVLGVTINKYNAAKSNGGDARRLKKEIWGYVAWIIFMAAVLGLQIWSVGGFQPKNISSSYSTPTELASQGAQEVKSSTALPYKVDSVTTLTDITADGSTIQYHYVLHDADTSGLSDDALRSAVQPNVCANTSTKTLLDHGVSMQYLYNVKDTSEQYSFTVTQGDC